MGEATMKKWLAILLATLAIAGCSQFRIGSAAIDPQFPQVSVVDGKYIVINQEPIVARRGGTITWQLLADKGLSFDRERGIVVEAFLKGPTMPSAKPFAALPAMAPQRAQAGRSLFECRARSEREFACQVPADAKPGQYAYSVRVMSGSMHLILDPTIFIEE